MDKFSFGYNGNIMKKYNKENENYGIMWLSGDVIGCYLDLDNQTISYSLNGRNLGTSFKDFVISGWPIVPAINVGVHQLCNVNFGNKKFVYVRSNVIC